METNLGLGKNTSQVPQRWLIYHWVLVHSPEPWLKEKKKKTVCQHFFMSFNLLLGIGKYRS